MSTTIAVSEETYKMLKYVKEETASESFDQLMQKLVRELKRTKENFFGAAKGLGPFKRKEFDRFETQWKKNS